MRFNFIILFAGMVYFTAGKKNRVIIVDDHEFTTERKFGEKILWCCTFKEKCKCRARCTTYGNTLEITYGHHSHIPNFQGSYSNLRASKMVVIKKEVRRSLS